jgi:hypothetical protein
LYNGHGQVVKQGVSNFLKAPLVRPFSTYNRYYYVNSCVRSISCVVKRL